MDRKTEEKPNDKTQQDTQNAEEWGDRVEAGRDIARGGRSDGCVEGATDKDSDDPRADADCQKSDEDS